eukprot:gene21227-28143_t
MDGSESKGYWYSASRDGSREGHYMGTEAERDIAGGWKLGESLQEVSD